MNLCAILVAGLISRTLSLECYDQLKCYGRQFYSLQYLLCDQASTTQCRVSFDYPVCSKRKGDAVDCSPDWFHSECYCRDLRAHENSATGSERCVCVLDKRAVGIVAGLGAAALIFAALTLFYSKRFSNMKRAARTAQVEMRVLNRMLETNRNGLASIQEHGLEEKGESPPPQYQERNIYQDDIQGDNGNQGQEDSVNQGDNVNQDQEDNGIYPDENIYNDLDDASTVDLAEACVV